MKYWIIADTHFGHSKLVERGYRPSGFEGRIFDQVAALISSDDVLTHLGDFCFGNDREWHERFLEVCKGKSWLIRGNHDRKTPTWYIRRGWSCVLDRLQLRMFGKTLVFSHRPVNVRGGVVNIHGHFHNNNHRHVEEEEVDEVDKNHWLVFIEHTYRPVDLRKFCMQKSLRGG